jgi:hypothetical protein
MTAVAELYSKTEQDTGELSEDEKKILAQLEDPDKPKDWTFKSEATEAYFLAYLVSDPTAAAEFSEYVNGDTFTVFHDQWIASAALNYFKEFKSLPPEDILMHLLASKLKDAQPEQRVRTQLRVEQIFNVYVPSPGTRPFIHAELVKWSKAKIVANALKGSLDKMKANEFDAEEYAKLMTKLQRLQTVGGASKVRRALTIPALATLPPITWHVEKHFPLGGFTCLYGPFASGKSFYMLDLALCIATGLPFMGYAVKQGPVAYVAAEGYHGMYKRIRAWLKHHAIQTPPLNFVLVPETFDMVADASAGTELAELAKSVLGEYPQFIVLDTLARMFGAGDENSTKDMNQYVANVDAMKRLCDGTVCSLHHTGKDFTKGARGAVALGAACDSMFQISGNPADGVELEVIKQKDAAALPPYLMKAKAIELDNDPDGSIVLQYAGVAHEETEKDVQDQLAKEEFQLLIHLPELNSGDVTPANGITADQLDALTGWDSKKVYRVMKRLVSKNKVQRKRFTGSASSPYFHWREAILSGVVL